MFFSKSFAYGLVYTSNKPMAINSLKNTSIGRALMYYSIIDEHVKEFKFVNKLKPLFPAIFLGTELETILGRYKLN